MHGGLRYLQQREYRLVYESLHERQRLLDNAPHLVHPLPFLIPLFGRGGVVSKTVAKAYSTALWLYDVTGGVRIGKWHKRVDAAEALAHFPDLRTDRLAAAFLYWDAQVDDARLTLAVARTAAAYGAILANYAPVAELLEADGRVAGARLADGTEVRARVVVNATGVWTEEVARLGPLDQRGAPVDPASQGYPPRGTGGQAALRLRVGAGRPGRPAVDLRGTLGRQRARRPAIRPGTLHVRRHHGHRLHRCARRSGVPRRGRAIRAGCRQRLDHRRPAPGGRDGRLGRAATAGERRPVLPALRTFPVATPSTPHRPGW